MHIDFRNSILVHFWVKFQWFISSKGSKSKFLNNFRTTPVINVQNVTECNVFYVVMMTIYVISSNIDKFMIKFLILKRFFLNLHYLKLSKSYFNCVQQSLPKGNCRNRIIFVWSWKTHVFNKGLCSFQETRDISPYRENSTCLADKISMNIVLVHSLSSII